MGTAHRGDRSARAPVGHRQLPGDRHHRPGAGDHGAAARRRGGGGQLPARAAGRRRLPVPRRLRGRRAGLRPADRGVPAAARAGAGRAAGGQGHRRRGRPDRGRCAVRARVRPGLPRGAGRRRPARLWSAGCRAGAAVEVDPAAGTVRVPAGVVLDLGATAKAYAADRAAGTRPPRPAAACWSRSAATSRSPEPARRAAGPSGWPTTRPPPTRTCPSVRIRSGGLATSSTAVRRWRRGGVGLHHIVDPVTGLPADTPWRTVSVAAASCLDAQIAATATMVRGLDWLARPGCRPGWSAPTATVRTVGGWPA